MMGYEYAEAGIVQSIRNHFALPSKVARRDHSRLGMLNTEERRNQKHVHFTEPGLRAKSAVAAKHQTGARAHRLRT